MGHRLELPRWDPLHWDGKINFENLTDIEFNDGFDRFTNPHISQIEAFTQPIGLTDPTDPLYIFKLDVTFTEGQVYTFMAPEFDQVDLTESTIVKD